MKASESSSASTSAATSSSAPDSPRNDSHRGDDPHAKKPAPPAEGDFLAQQAQDAQLAMAAAWTDLKHALASGADVRAWTKRYPWFAAGGALAAGVAAGYLLTPRDKDEAKELWEKLKAKLAGSGVDENTVVVEPANGKAAPAQKSSIFGTILREAIKSAAPLMTSMLGAAVGGGQAAQHQQDDRGSPT